MSRQFSALFPNPLLADDIDDLSISHSSISPIHRNQACGPFAIASFDGVDDHLVFAQRRAELSDAGRRVHALIPLGMGLDSVEFGPQTRTSRCLNVMFCTLSTFWPNN
jgi:hypothetical protein